MPAKTAADNATDFVFRVEGLKLSSADQDRISQAIAGAVNAELLKMHKPADPPIIIKPFPWPGGIWIKNLDAIAAIEKAKQFLRTKVNVTFGG